SLAIPNGGHVRTAARGHGMKVSAGGIAYINFRASTARRREREVSAIGRPGGGKIGATEVGEADETIQFGREHKDVPSRLGQRTEGKARTVGRNAGRQRNGRLVSELTLVGAVIIHGPDFFVARAIADEINFAFRDAGDAATETKDDFVGELVSDKAGGIFGGDVAVLLADDQRRGRVLDVIEPAL